MSAAKKSFPLKLVSGFFRKLAKYYISTKKPIVVVVAGSVGKTSSKLFAAQIISSERSVSYMDDSYNNDLGLYLSVFKQKVPSSLKNPFCWLPPTSRAISSFFRNGPDVIILEYGIDHPGDMKECIDFIRPDYTLLTAIAPEHMEYFKSIDTVAKEEIIAANSAKVCSVVNASDIDKKYLKSISRSYIPYGEGVRINKLTKSGAIIDISTPNNQYLNIKTKLIAEPLIRQLSGAIILAEILGLSEKNIKNSIPLIEPAASRMRLLEGIHGCLIIDDSTNFSPNAGVEAIKTLDRIPGKRKIAILGNMHELGDYIEEGYRDVAKYFNKIDMIITVGDLSKEHFGRLAVEQGFKDKSNLFHFDDSVSAGRFVRDSIVSVDDVVLVKGPFGGYYLEEATKRLLRNKKDVVKLTRQSSFWDSKKRLIFGNDFDID